MLKFIEHIAIAAAEPTALARWYCDTLDFQMLIAAEESRTYFVGLPGGGIFEIMPAMPTPLTPTTHDTGFHHIALGVDDFDVAYQRLQVRGVRFVGPRYHSPDGGTLFDFFIDPEGNRLQLVYRAKSLAP